MTWKPSTLQRSHPNVRQLQVEDAGGRTFEFHSIDRCSAVRVQVRLDEAEHQRRLQRGIGAVKRGYHVEALHSLQRGVLSPFPPRFDEQAQDLQKLGFASFTEDPDGGLWASRVVGNPLFVLNVELEASTWRRALKGALEWTGYGPRTLAAPGLTERNVIALAEADVYGVGAKVAGSDTFLLRPAPFAPERWSPARWLISELLYAELLRNGVLTSSADLSSNAR